MGGNQSINQSNDQLISNAISQVSNGQCINQCVESGAFTINITDSDIGNFNIKKGCNINSASCNLKASLDSSLTNDLSDTQKSKQSDLEGPFTLLSEMMGGGNQSIDQTNYQAISNEASQQMNSLCLTQAIDSSPVTVNVTDSKIKNFKQDYTTSIGKSTCTIDNMAKFYAQNSETNTQSASQTRAGIGALIALIIVVILLGGVMGHHGKKGNDEGKGIAKDVIDSGIGEGGSDGGGAAEEESALAKLAAV